MRILIWFAIFAAIGGSACDSDLQWGSATGSEDGGFVGDTDTATGAEADTGVGEDDTDRGTDTAGGAQVDAGPDEASDNPYTPEERVIMESLLPRLEFLADHTIQWWMTHGVDGIDGGFYGTLDSQGNSTAPYEKGVIAQSRHLWSLSMWHSRRGTGQDAKAIADDTYRFLVTHFLDADDGLFFFKTDAKGNVVDGKKKLYAQAFAIYGLSRYALAFGVDEAANIALTCFEAVDRASHDDLYGGYDQTDDPDSWINGAAKGTNTHIHLMEAFTTLYEATGDSAVRARLDELVDMTAQKLLQPQGYLHPAFSRDWTPIGAPEVSYGHDLETAWLLMEAARLLGREQESAVVNGARRMATHAAAFGEDTENRGYFEKGVPNGTPLSLEKIWWVQFEALSGLWWTFTLTGDIVQLQRLEAVLQWIEEVRDEEHGEWYWSHLPNGELGPRGDLKGAEWKTSYHNLRALVFTYDWIDGAL